MFHRFLKVLFLFGSNSRLYFQTQNEDVPLSVLPLSGITWCCNGCNKLGGVWSKAIFWLCVFIQLVQNTT